ncbi:MAG TPA: hypothetical protein VGK33_01185 [Chloroflexota bacterium]
MSESETREEQLTLALREAIQYLDLVQGSSHVPPEVRQRWDELLRTEQRSHGHQKLRQQWTEVLAAEARNFHLNTVFLGGPLTPRADPRAPQVPPEQPAHDTPPH